MLPEFVIEDLLDYYQERTSFLLEKKAVNIGDFINIDYIGTSLLNPDFFYMDSIDTWCISATIDTENPNFILINKAKINNEELDQESVNNSVIEYLAMQELNF